MALIAFGCSPKEENTQGTAAATQPPAPAAVSIAGTAAPVAPPPSAGAAAPAAAISVAQADRPINAQGNPMSDLEFLNHLIHEVNESRISSADIPQKAFKTEAEQMAYEEAQQQKKGPVRDLNELVTAGVLKEIPPAPAGQRYAIDATTGKVVLQ
jgi:hypothetical protein